MSSHKGCPGCKQLNERITRERTFTSWVYMCLLNRVESKRIVIAGKEIKALSPADEPIIEQDPNRGTITLKVRSRPKLERVK